MQKLLAVSFFIWRIGLIFVAFLATILIPRFGGAFPYYQSWLQGSGLPAWLWGFGNFDGVHYLIIASGGYYARFTQAFFPAFPEMIKFLTFGSSYLLTGLVIANSLFLASLYLFYKLLKIDFSEKITRRSIFLLLAFPTAYYFGSVYSESLFLFLTLLSLIFVRRKNYLLAGLFAAFASATRILGLMLMPVILIEAFLDYRHGDLEIPGRKFLNTLTGLIIAPLGTLFYMLYLQINFHNAFYFLTSQPEFGAGRSGQPFILLPQVIYRYLKMLLTVPTNTLAFYNVLLEFLFTILPLVLLLVGIKKIRPSYWIFVFGCLIVPTLTGTFSSMPRYALMSFLTLPFLVTLSGKYYKYLLAVFIILQAILVSIFVRGYWVA